MISQAFAMAGAPAEGASQSGGAFGMLIPILLMFGIMYLLIIRPQQKKSRDHQKMLSALSKGDEVVTSGGLYGKVTGITDKVLTIEIADKVKVKVSRGHIAGKKGDAAAEQPQTCSR